MNKHEKFVITINRQFGTGGHEVGAAIAERLGVKLLDKQILEAVARKFDIDQETVDKLESRNMSWWDDFTQFYRSYMIDNTYHDLGPQLTSHELFEAQAAVIKQIAEEESCVVIGRCAFDIFKDHPNSLKIFIHSPEEKRIRRIVEKYGVSPDDAKLMIVDNDYTRELYTKTFTGSEWYDARNYDVSLDVSKFGLNGTVNYLMALVGDD
ncbi:MAG: cytidylate kinase-like family protein [Prevotella sp.]|nr:cytidylate kinase-like family protein [Prevotella sp.]